MNPNPYAAYLGNRDAREVISETPARLGSLVNKLGSRVEEPRAPGKWSTREITTHLADCEIVFAYRLRQILAEPHHVIQPFDQDKWAASYRIYDAASALALFSALRNWNVALVRSLTPEQLSKKVNHPERGEMTFEVVLQTMAGHDLNHLKQVEEIAAR